jgi:hypothetical protein
VSNSVRSSRLLLRPFSFLRLEILGEECRSDGLGTLIARKSISSAILYNIINILIYIEYRLFRL